MWCLGRCSCYGRLLLAVAELGSAFAWAVLSFHCLLFARFASLWLSLAAFHCRFSAFHSSQLCPSLIAFAAPPFPAVNPSRTSSLSPSVGCGCISTRTSEPLSSTPSPSTAVPLSPPPSDACGSVACHRSPCALLDDRAAAAAAPL